MKNKNNKEKLPENFWRNFSNLEIVLKIFVGIVILMSVFFIANGFSWNGSLFSIDGISGRVVSADYRSVNNGDVQIVKLSVSGSKYIFEPAVVKKGTTVRIEADISSMSGCSKSIVSSELGIRKTFSGGDNILEFTPTKAGKFFVSCSMNMYNGQLEVLESDGTKSNYVQSASTGGHTCGGSGSGCGGCGGR